MRIGRLEIRWAKEEGFQRSLDFARRDDKVDRTGVFAVPDTQDWWRAVHWIVDMAEQETIQSARKRIANTNQCIGDVGAGEGVALVRQKLIDARNAALEGERLKVG